MTGAVQPELAEWAGFTSARSFKQHIERLKPDLEQWGSLYIENTMITIGKGGHPCCSPGW
jgi:hypothetical protein